MKKLLLKFNILMLAVFGMQGCTDSDEWDVDQLPSSSPNYRYSESCSCDTLKLLLIGNSFACDAVDNYLNPMLKFDEVPYIIARLHLSSGSLQTHYENAITNAPCYEYKKHYNDKESEKKDNYTIEDALVDEKWTHISLQQVSTDSGIYSTYTQPLTSLMSYLRYRVCHDTQYIWHQTWAYADDYQGDTFSVYGYDSDFMYRTIENTTQLVMADYRIKLVVPSGRAINIANKGTLNNSLHRDGRHLSNIGKYVVSATWYEIITSNDSRLLPYQGFPLSTDDMDAACEAAHAAVEGCSHLIIK